MSKIHLPVEKSRSICVKFGHLADNSCKTVCVISSIGNSMYRKVGPKRIAIRDSRESNEPTWSPDTSGLNDTFFHNLVSYAT